MRHSPLLECYRDILTDCDFESPAVVPGILADYAIMARSEIGEIQSCTTWCRLVQWLLWDDPHYGK
jgi:hypothetical protein